MFNTIATVKVKNDAGKVVASQDYDKVVFDGIELVDGKVNPGTDIEGLLGAAIAYFQEFVGAEGSGVLEMLKAATYAHDLDRRAKIRGTLVSAIEGPDKAIEKQVKAYMAGRAASGKPVTEAVARERVKRMMEEED
jgi:hypothetical protein